MPPSTKRIPAIALAPLLFAGSALAHSPGEKARVYFENLRDGQQVRAPFEVRFGIEGFGVVPASTRDASRHHGGHFHLLVDAPKPPALDEPLPNDEHCIHFDDGERRTLLDLPPGRHRLQLILGDEDHEPFDPPLMSPEITIQVE